jgi:hypothetical protein
MQTIQGDFMNRYGQACNNFIETDVETTLPVR